MPEGLSADVHVFQDRFKLPFALETRPRVEPKKNKKMKACLLDDAISIL
jgi:hypothetical protein